MPIRTILMMVLTRWGLIAANSHIPAREANSRQSGDFFVENRRIVQYSVNHCGEIQVHSMAGGLDGVPVSLRI